jgi:hypothetical protein
MRRSRGARRIDRPARGRAGALVLGLVLASFGAPASGADPVVSEEGPVRASLRVEPQLPRIGDTILLELEVVADAGVELLMPEFGEALERFAVVDFAPSESVDAEGRTVARQRYRLQPARSGPQSIPPLLIEFVDRRPGRTPAPEGADAYELLTERVAFEVQSMLTSDDALELSPSRGQLGPLETPGGPLWPWLLAGGVGLAALAPFAARALVARRARSRRRSAYEVARSELDTLLYAPRPAAGDAAAIDAFYVALSGIVRRYLESRFGLHSPEQTTDEFLESLASSPDLKRSHQDLLREFLQGADLVKFAHRLPSAAEINESVGLAQRFLEETGEVRDA